MLSLTLVVYSSGLCPQLCPPEFTSPSNCVPVNTTVAILFCFKRSPKGVNNTNTAKRWISVTGISLENSSRLAVIQSSHTTNYALLKQVQPRLIFIKRVLSYRDQNCCLYQPVDKFICAVKLVILTWSLMGLIHYWSELEVAFRRTAVFGSLALA